MSLKILLSGGGTGGSITPLLAIAEELVSSRKEVDSLWIGSKKGIEKEMVEKEKIRFKAIYSGKLRRYFDLKNFIDPIFIIIGFFQSLWIILRYQPDIILTAGSFIAVPVVWAGWILRIPVLVHQQDVEVGRANKLMAPFASIITCSLEESVRNFLHNEGETSPVRRVGGKSRLRQIYFTGNAVRRKILEAHTLTPPFDKLPATECGAGRTGHTHQKFGVVADSFKGGENRLPTLLILGGGTGAFAVNKIVVQSIPELVKICNVVHVTGDKFPSLGGEGRSRVFARITLDTHKALDFKFSDRYHSYPFLNNIEEALTSADIVISRCGMSFLSELAVLGKPSILIPIPDSHQEANAKYFGNRNAAIILNQKKLTPEILIYTVRGILKDKNKTRELSENISKIMPSDGASRIAKIVMKYILK